MTTLDMKDVWKIIKKIRKSFLTEHPDLHCNILISDRSIKDIVRILEENLNLNTTSKPIENVPYKTLQTAAEMFTYLNYCPIISKPLLFRTHLLDTGSPKEMILALPSLMKSSQNCLNRQKL